MSQQPPRPTFAIFALLLFGFASLMNLAVAFAVFRVNGTIDVFSLLLGCACLYFLAKNWKRFWATAPPTAE